MTRSVLIAGLSTRAAADSAAAAGFAVTALDAFGDLDLHSSVRGVSLPRDLGVPFSAAAAARAAAGFAADAVVYLANFENEPDAVGALAQGRALWGNPPDVLRRVRDPALLMKTLRAHGIAAPSVALNATDAHEWLLKPIASGGGRGVRAWDRTWVPRGHYLQERIDGVPGSIVFVAADGAAVPLGLSRQLIGDPAFGADGYRYCGNILAPADDPVFEDDDALMTGACAIASAAAASFGLVGLNGVDFVAAGGVAQPVEVNPRWSGAMELVERAYGISLFGIHADACARGALPAFDLRRGRRAPMSGTNGRRALGKAILFARELVTLGDTTPWLTDASVRDVPQPRGRIAAGRPICTIFADGGDAASCHSALVRRAEHLYASIKAGSRLD